LLGAEYLTLTTAANEAFVLGCLFEISAGKRNFSNSGAFKAANMVKDLVKECRKNTATNEDDREHFRDQRKQMFHDWGIFGKRAAGLEILAAKSLDSVEPVMTSKRNRSKCCLWRRWRKINKSKGIVVGRVFEAN